MHTYIAVIILYPNPSSNPNPHRNNPSSNPILTFGGFLSLMQIRDSSVYHGKGLIYVVNIFTRLTTVQIASGTTVGGGGKRVSCLH